jgi:hypothetical protein
VLSPHFDGGLCQHKHVLEGMQGVGTQHLLLHVLLVPDLVLLRLGDVLLQGATEARWVNPHVPKGVQLHTNAMCPYQQRASARHGVSWRQASPSCRPPRARPTACPAPCQSLPHPTRRAPPSASPGGHCRTRCRRRSASWAGWAGGQAGWQVSSLLSNWHIGSNDPASRTATHVLLRLRLLCLVRCGLLDCSFGRHAGVDGCRPEISRTKQQLISLVSLAHGLVTGRTGPAHVLRSPL